MMTKAEQQLFDLTGTVYHEYGHLIVARHYGCFGYVRIWENDNFDDEEMTYEKRVLGRCYFIGGIDDLLTDEQRLHVGLAGVCTEHILDYDEITEHDYEEIADIIFTDNGSLSESDIEMMGGQIPDDLAQYIQVIRIIHQHWDDLKRESQLNIDSESEVLLNTNT